MGKSLRDLEKPIKIRLAVSNIFFQLTHNGTDLMLKVCLSDFYINFKIWQFNYEQKTVI